MRASPLFLIPILLTSCAATQRSVERWKTTLHQDTEGFSVNLPQDWKVQKFGVGSVAIIAPAASEFVVVIPVLGRTTDCNGVLRNTFNQGWRAFPGVQNLNVGATGRGLALADFQFQNGQSRGAVLCAETGARSAMFYGMAAPAAQFATDRAGLVAILRSFKYGSGGKEAVKANAPQAARMEPWTEPSESAFSALKPAGWKVDGGVVRISNNDVRTGNRLVSPDGMSGLILGDVRMNNCVIPGQFSRQFTNQSPGAGREWCPYRTGEQVAELYAMRAIAADWQVEGMRITGRRARPDLTAGADRLAGGNTSFRNAFGEVQFEGTRRGVAVSGRVVANTLLMVSPDANLTGGSYQQSVNGFIGPKGSESEMSSLMSQVQGSMKWNMQWVMANRAAGARDTAMVRRYMESSAQLGQQMYEDRMASADRRAAAVGDLLAGQVRLKDNEGNQYQAHAGSNYYFLNEQEGRIQSNPNNAVVGTDSWVPLSNGVVDLRPLEVIQ